MKKTARKKYIALCLLAAGLLGRFWYSKQALQKVKETVSFAQSFGQQLILDAGHGGEDGGAVSITGVPESSINLSVVLKLDQLLGFCGVSPILLRDSDISLHDPQADTLRKKKVSDLHNRVAAIESVTDSVVISIHQNTFSNPAYHGAQVFFRQGAESQALALMVQNTIHESLDLSNNRTPAKIPDSVYLMKHITRPAILVVCGFLSNPEEEAKLRESSYQTQLALCVVSAWLNSGEIWTGEMGSGML